MMRRHGWGMLIAASVLVNMGMIGLAPLLSHERQSPEEEEIASAVSLVKLTPPRPAEREERKAPRKPKPQEAQDFKPDLIQPQFAGLGGGMDAGIAIDIGGIGGGEIGGEFIFESYELDQPPQPVVNVPPVYPYHAREQGVEGVVQVRILVRADGNVGQVLILGARPEGVFEEAVRKAVPQWRFEPGKVEGEPVAAWVVTALRFEL